MTNKIIKGVSASKGKVKGSVKIINRKEDFEKFREGDIIVTSVPKPAEGMYVGRAGAIIMDEGNITCHWAKKARELKKPCIVSARIATKELHDGDEVEVDGDTGIIKVL